MQNSCQLIQRTNRDDFRTLSELAASGIPLSHGASRPELPLCMHFLLSICAAALYISSMRILLTGASGFLGSTCVTLLCRYPDIELSVARVSQAECSLPLGCREIQLDNVTSPQSLQKAFESGSPTHIIHCAALSSPLRCEEDSAYAHYSNVAYTKMLADYARSVNAHMTLVSTDLVFDGCRAPTAGFNESHKPLPLSVYARSKIEAERATLESSDSNAVVRVSLLYGYSLSSSRGVLGWMEETWAKGDALTLFADEFRTPVHVADAAHALLHLSAESRSGVWHCGGPERLSRVDFGRAVADALGYDSVRILPRYRAELPTTPPRPEDVSLNSSKLYQAINFSPRTVSMALRDSYDPRKSA